MNILKPTRNQLFFNYCLPLISILLFTLTACQSGPVVNAAVVPAVTVSSPELPPVITVTLPPPAIISAPASQPPSFSLVDPADLVTATAVPPTTTTTNTPPATATETASLTPQPTFTPPSLPLTSPDEHYWLRRPIPEGGTVWTDKTYPYGSTRGGTLRPHHGVEFYVPTGTEIIAAASGIVRVVGDDTSVIYGPHANFYGNLVVIELDSRWHGQPVFNLYGHVSTLLVNEGQHVNAQETIALSGATGVADGPHLHFEVRLGQNSYDNTRNPLLWLYPFPDFSSVAGRVTWPSGELVEEAPISLRRIDAPSRYLATTSYAGTHVNPDNNWQENFVLDDVPAGYYEITVNTGEKKYKQELWVFPYRTSFVEIVLGQ